MMYLQVATVFLLTSIFGKSLSVTLQEEQTAISSCQALLTAVPGRIAGFVRLSFHDCVGNCDGCLNMNLLDSSNDDMPNAGLDGHLNTLANSYSTLGSSMSRADYFALCGVVAAVRGRENALSATHGSMALPIQMLYGRPDAPTCNAQGRYTRTDHLSMFPNPRLGHAATMSWCANTFGMSTSECVALMGAHTLGRTRTTASGYNGPWTRRRGTSQLNNEYFRELNNVRQWGQVDVNPMGTTDRSRRWQYVDNNRRRRSPQQIMMLNTDVCLLKDITANATTGKAELSLVGVTNAATSQLVGTYAQNDNLWVSAFWPVYKKMIETVASGVTLSAAA